MLLKDYRSIAELDDKITALQRELVLLYERRISYFGSNTPTNSRSATNKPGKAVKLASQPVGKITDNTRELYDRLAVTWRNYGLNLPIFGLLSQRLATAQQVATELGLARPELAGHLEVILVPPTEELNRQQLAAWRGQQSFVLQADHFGEGIKQSAAHANWRILVAHAATEGLKLGSAETIIDDQLYLMAGFDTRALGVSEYLALSLQCSKAYDVNRWTLLLKDLKNGQLPSVCFKGGQFRFEVDDITGLSDEECFRPAVEIKE